MLFYGKKQDAEPKNGDLVDVFLIWSKYMSKFRGELLMISEWLYLCFCGMCWLDGEKGISLSRCYEPGERDI